MGVSGIIGLPVIRLANLPPLQGEPFFGLLPGVETPGLVLKSLRDKGRTVATPIGLASEAALQGRDPTNHHSARLRLAHGRALTNH